MGDAPLNRKAGDFDLKDLLDAQKRDIMFSMNCHAVGIVQSFNPTKQTLVAKIAYKKTYMQKGVGGNFVPVFVDYPIIIDCPILCVSGGKANLTMPIKPGDECLLFFNDRDIDNWFQNSQVVAPETTRLHSFSDAMALVGLHSSTRVIPAYDPNRIGLINNVCGLSISETHVRLFNLDTTLNTLIQQLITEIKSITTTNCVVGSPVTLSPASIASLTALAVDFGGLLE